jgi:WD40 repeat protein
MAVGTGGMAAKLVTCSNDQTVRVWLASSGESLGCVALFSPARCLVVTPLESTAFVGLADGTIVQVSLNKARPVGEALEHEGDATRRLSGHTRAVCSLSLTMSGDLLVSGALPVAKCQDFFFLLWQVPASVASCLVICSPVHKAYMQIGGL